MEKEIMDVSTGTILEIFIPEEYDDELEEFKEDYEVHYIGLNIKINDRIITIIKSDEDKYCNLFVGDKVNVIHYKRFYNYIDYCEKLFEKVYRYHLSDNIEEKEKIFHKLITDEDDNRNLYYVTDYEIEKI